MVENIILFFMKNNLLNSKRGFTLIEILVVVSIIGLLSSVFLVGLGGFRSRGRDARRLADLRQVQNALEVYYTKCQRYPGGVNCAAGDPAGWSALQSAITQSGLGISQLANDPQNLQITTRTYGYAVSTDGQNYLVGATLENTGDPSLNEDSDLSSFAGYNATANFTGCADPV